MLLITCFCILFFIPNSITQCPFSSSLKLAQLNQQQDEAKKDSLIERNYLVAEGDPGWFFFIRPALNATIGKQFGTTYALLQAQQLYAEQITRHYQSNNDSVRPTAASYLSEATPHVDLHDRCAPQPRCDPAEKYASRDGSCNNLQWPTMGTSFSAYSRLLAANYDDGTYEVRRSWRTRQSLPSPRAICNVAMQHPLYDPVPDIVPNHGSYIFGQYITHDIALRSIHQNFDGGDGLRCCTKDNKRPLSQPQAYPHCMPMEIPRDDDFLAQFDIGCMEYARTQPIFAMDCSLGPAEMSNSVTHHLDASTIYGSTDADHQSIRAFVGGRLRTSDGEFFPRTANCSDQFCDYTGDIRGTLFTTLSAWHLLYIRLHNVIAAGLAKVNAHWSDDRMFEESRRIVIACYQNAVFNDWLPTYLGEEAARRRHLSCPRDVAYCGRYNASVDCRVMQEFSTAAFRLFHANTPFAVNYYGKEYELKASIPLADSINGAGILKTDLDDVVRGMLKDPIAMGAYPDHIRNHLFNHSNQHGIGMDLPATDILSARDHGLQPYHVHLEHLWGDGRKVESWEDFEPVLSTYSIARLQEVYDDPRDVDPMVGMTLEEKHGTLTGPVAQWIIEEQFYRLKYGNRFHYTFANGANPFTEAQILSINRMGFAEVVCLGSDVGWVPANVFEIIDDQNPLERCSGYVVDYQLWAEDSST